MKTFRESRDTAEDRLAGQFREALGPPPKKDTRSPRDRAEERLSRRADDRSAEIVDQLPKLSETELRRVIDAAQELLENR